MKRWFLLLIMVLVSGLTVSAQDTGGAGEVTLDDVNAVAENMYCPECENIPLDKCGTPVCIQWKNEIAAQLAAGRSGDEIVSDFVTRFGDRVVGVPQDPTLRMLSLAAPWLIAALVLILGVTVFMRLLRGRADLPASAALDLPPASAADDALRAQVERDLHR
jgi:cytochrome c-type biogenesis protein CcmH